MKPQPEYRAYLYPTLGGFGLPRDPDEPTELRVLSFFFERCQLAGLYRYACAKCQMVTPRDYFVTSAFYGFEDLPESIPQEISEHARAHQIIGAAERRGFVVVSRKELENLKSLVSALGG